MTRPSLFHYATSELSQDAFLCWLAAWAAPVAADKDQHLHALGRKFVAMLMELNGRSLSNITSLKIWRQHKGIDILILMEPKLAICIEDKVGSTEHSNQLERYRQVLEESFKSNEIIYAYIQTLEQCSYAAVSKACYAVVSRKMLLQIIEPYARITGANAIALDFYEHLSRVDLEVDSFKREPPAKWPDRGLVWQGFYCELQAKGLNGKWGYIANPTGGFWGYWWHGNKGVYLQLEESKLRFKSSVNQAAGRYDLEDLRARLIEQGRVHGLNVVRPKRTRLGQTTTLAMLEPDYRVTNMEDRLDIDATVARLRTAEKVLDDAVPRDDS